MKYVVLVGDGMGDWPVRDLEGRTPLEVARTPNMDFIARNGRVGTAQLIPGKMPPGSDVANLAVFGYNPEHYYPGRAPLEAANMGIKLENDEVAFRCNLVTCEDEVMVDYSAGHITSREAEMLIKVLNEELSSKECRFYPGVSYRHLLVIKDPGLVRVKCTPPHDISGKKITGSLPKGKGSERLIKLMRDSQSILAGQEINRVRIDLKENPANMIWLWGQGQSRPLPRFREKYGVDGSVISAVDLINGIGRTIGLDVIKVPGATGYYDTDYAAKARYAIDSLKEKDFVFVHVEAPDEAGHNGHLKEKINAIQNLDALVVGKFLDHFKRYRNFRIMILPDHLTPVEKKTHVSDPVPWMMMGGGIAPHPTERFTEAAAKAAENHVAEGYRLMEAFFA